MWHGRDQWIQVAGSLRDKLQAQKAMKALEATSTKKRRELFDAPDAIDVRRCDLIARIASQLRQQHAVNTLFTCRWRVQ